MMFKKTLLAAAVFALGGVAFNAMAAVPNATGQTATGQFNVTMTIKPTCSITSAGDIAFGAVAASTAGTAPVSNTIKVACSKNTPYVINLSPQSIATAATGNTSTTGAGFMYSSTNNEGVAYQLHAGSANGSNWGNTGTGVSGAAIVAGNGVTGTGAGMNAAASYSAYATVANTDFTPGSDYKDIVQVSVAY